MTLVSKAFSDIITFSRSSNATRIGPTGRVEYAPHNLLTRSQEFDNASWAKTRSSVTANTVAAPDGTITADSLIEDSTASNTHLIQQDFSAVSGVTYTKSYYVKASTRTWCAIYGGGLAFSTAPYSFFNLSTGVIGSYGNGVLSPTITSVGNGWYRISITVIATTGSTANLALRLATGDNTSSYTGDGVSGIYIWGAQLSVGPYPLDYTPTTSAAVYGPRFDYDPVTLAARGLLVEEQRTNLLTYSEQFDNAAWGKFKSTVTANASNAPDGVTTADSLIEDSDFGEHFLNQQLSKAGSNITYTFSVYFKNASGSRNLGLGITNGTTGGFAAVFSTSGTVVQTSVAVGSTTGFTFVSATNTIINNGYCRATITVTTDTATRVDGVIYNVNGTTRSYTGDGTSGFHIWGAQLEAGSFATSYIPTVAASVTRSADVASVNTLSPWFNSVEGSFYFEGDTGLASGKYPGLYKTGTTNPDRVGQYVNANGTTDFYRVSQLVSASSVTNQATFKTATAYSGSQLLAVVNGGTVASASASDSLTLPTQMYLGRFDEYMSGHIRRFAYYPRKLSSAELQALTA